MSRRPYARLHCACEPLNITLSYSALLCLRKLHQAWQLGTVRALDLGKTELRWTCASCTFVNDGEHRECAVCGGDRGDAKLRPGAASPPIAPTGGAGAGAGAAVPTSATDVSPAADASAKRAPVTSVRDRRSGHVFVNLTGEECEVHVVSHRHTGHAVPTGLSVVVPANEEVSLRLPQDAYLKETQSVGLQIDVEGFSCPDLYGLPIDGFVTQSMRLEPLPDTDKGNLPVTVYYAVRIREGVTTCELHAPVELVNRTSVALDCMANHARGSSSLHLPAASTVAVPVHLHSCRSVSLCPSTAHGSKAALAAAGVAEGAAPYQFSSGVNIVSSEATPAVCTTSTKEAMFIATHVHVHDGMREVLMYTPVAVTNLLPVPIIATMHGVSQSGGGFDGQHIMVMQPGDEHAVHTTCAAKSPALSLQVVQYAGPAQPMKLFDAPPAGLAPGEPWVRRVMLHAESGVFEVCIEVTNVVHEGRNVSGAISVKLYCEHWIVDHTPMRLQPGVRTARHAAVRGLPFVEDADGLMCANSMDCDRQLRLREVSSSAARPSAWVAIPVGVEGSGVVTVRSGDPGQGPKRRSMDVAFSVARCPAPFQRTLLTTLHPWLQLVNETGMALFVREAGSATGVSKAEPGSTVGIEFGVRGGDDASSDAASHLIQLAAPHDGSTPASGTPWSGTIDAAAVDEYPLLVDTGAFLEVFRVTVRAHPSVAQALLVVVELEGTEAPGIRVRNDTKVPLLVSQQLPANVRRYMSIEPGSFHRFGWQEPRGSHELLVAPAPAGIGSPQREPGRFSVLQLAPVGGAPTRLSDAGLGSDNRVNVSIVGDGPTTEVRAWRRAGQAPPPRIVRASSLRRMHAHGAGDDDHGSEAATAIGGDGAPQAREWQTSIAIAGIGLSVVDPQPSEQLFVYMEGVDVSLARVEREMAFSARVMRVQVDDLHRRSPYPVVLASASAGTALQLGLEYESHPTTHVFRFLNMQLAPLYVRVYTQLLEHLARWVAALRSGFNDVDTLARAPQVLHDVHAAPQVLSAATQLELEQKGGAKTGSRERSTLATKKLYFESLVVTQVQLFLSTRAISATESQPRGFRYRDPTPLPEWVAMVLKVDDMDDTRLTFDEFMLGRMVLSSSELMAMLSAHASSNWFRNALRIAGNANVFGRPLNFVRHVTDGATDLVEMPVSGLQESPLGAVGGVAVGVTSLAGHVTSGALDTVSALTRTVANVAAHATFDDRQIQKNARKGASKPTNVVSGFGAGFLSLGKGLFRGVAAPIRGVVEGAREGGFAGAVCNMLVGWYECDIV